MKKGIWITVIACLVTWPLCAAGQSLTPDDIMDRLEARYHVEGIFVRFHQTSTLKAMDITESAEGQIYIKQPGCMRWEYETPEKQSIITDGESLWVYRPDDHQVMMGSAATYFGEGNGGAFLADMTLIRKYFTVELAAGNPAEYYELKLTPGEPSGDIQTVTLNVSKENFNILQVATVNSYGDETHLTFEATEFGRVLDDTLFTFIPPEGVDIVPLD